MCAYFYGSGAKIPGFLDYMGGSAAAAPTASTPKTAASYKAAGAAPATAPNTAVTMGTANAAAAPGNDCASQYQQCLDNCPPAEYRDPTNNPCPQRCQELLNSCLGGGGGGGGGDTTPTEGCPPEAKNNGGGYAGCGCGTKFPMPASGSCPPGYVVVRNADGTIENSTVNGVSGPICACLKWCESIGRSGTDCSVAAGTGTGAGTLGEFQWPSEITDLYKSLVGRGQGLVDNPGYTDAAMSAMFGPEFEKVRNLEHATRESTMGVLGRQGQLGTGAGNKAMIQTGWNTERGISDLMRNLFVANEAQKRADYTQGQGILGTGMDYSRFLEAINAARRGEGSDALLAMLQLYMANLPGWNR